MSSLSGPLRAGEGLASLFSDAAKQRFARAIPVPTPVSQSEPEVNDEQEDEDEASKVNLTPEEAKAKKEEEDKRTVFVGNIPVTESKKSITKLFSPCGPIESVRLRSVPFAGAKVDESGNQNLVRKVCTNQKLFGEQKVSVTFVEKMHFGLLY
jgi:RNA recognition motif-containing protein